MDLFGNNDCAAYRVTKAEYQAPEHRMFSIVEVLYPSQDARDKAVKHPPLDTPVFKTYDEARLNIVEQVAQQRAALMKALAKLDANVTNADALYGRPSSLESELSRYHHLIVERLRGIVDGKANSVRVGSLTMFQSRTRSEVQAEDEYQFNISKDGGFVRTFSEKAIALIHLAMAEAGLVVSHTQLFDAPTSLYIRVKAPETVAV